MWNGNIQVGAHLEKLWEFKEGTVCSERGGVHQVNQEILSSRSNVASHLRAETCAAGIYGKH